MNWKETYTKIFLNQQNKSIDDANIKQYMPIWWQNTRNKDSGGLRLTDRGYEMLLEIGVATYDIPYPSELELTTQVIIFLDHFIDCPYYLGKRSISVTNEKKAVELTLFAGDLRKYGIVKAMTKSKKMSDNG